MKPLTNIHEYVRLNAAAHDERAGAFQEALRCTQAATTPQQFIKIVRSMWEDAYKETFIRAYYDILWYALEQKPEDVFYGKNKERS